MTDFDEHGRPEPPEAGDELETLTGFLDYQRSTFAWKCSNLSADDLTTKIGSSSMTLGGMIKHLALVEDWWFSQCLRDRQPQAPWKDVDWELDPDWDWISAASDAPEQILELWASSTAQSRLMVEEAMLEGGLDQRARRAPSKGQSPSLRWILCHMIEEYARHNGHADLLRESIDGSTGE
ncbi:MAG: DinB family protein [Acidimicrobiaceae bacterium]|nr:DinB family protein [Acidimicrobiaceae bacterium]